MKRILLLPMILLLGAGSDDQLGQKKYVLPAGTTATATMKFLKGNLRLSMMRGDVQYYGLMTEGSCKASKKLITYSGGIGGNTQEKLVPVEAGHKVRLLGTVIKQSDGGYMSERFFSCSNVLEFTPVAGKNYIVTQKTDHISVNFACHMAIVDDQSGAAPDDLSEIPAPSCRI